MHAVQRYVYETTENVENNFDLLFFFHPLFPRGRCFAYKLRGLEHARTYRQSSDHQVRESEKRWKNFSSLFSYACVHTYKRIIVYPKKNTEQFVRKTATHMTVLNTQVR